MLKSYLMHAPHIGILFFSGGHLGFCEFTGVCIGYEETNQT